MLPPPTPGNSFRGACAEQAKQVCARVASNRRLVRIPAQAAAGQRLRRMMMPARRAGEFHCVVQQHGQQPACSSAASACSQALAGAGSPHARVMARPGLAAFARCRAPGRPNPAARAVGGAARADSSAPTMAAVAPGPFMVPRNCSASFARQRRQRAACTDLAQQRATKSGAAARAGRDRRRYSAAPRAWRRRQFARWRRAPGDGLRVWRFLRALPFARVQAGLFRRVPR